MKANKLIAIIAMICWLPAYAGNLVDMLDMDDSSVRQIPGSEEIVKEYFKGDTGVVYAMIYPVANCPRCEAAINDCFSMIKERVDNPTILISDFHDKKTAELYNKKKGYVADRYIYDDCERFYDFLSFSDGVMHIVYLLKIDVDSGKLMFGCNDGYVIDSEFMDELVADDGYLPQFDYDNNKSRRLNEVAEYAFANELSPARSIRFELPDSIGIYDIYMRPAFDGRHFAMTDRLWYEVYLFELNYASDALKFKSVIKSSPEENRTFVEIPEKFYQSDLKNGTVYFMPLSPMFCDDGTISVSYSLPNLFVTKEVDGEVRGIGYSNASCLITRGIDDNREYPLFNIDVEGDDFFVKHFSFQRVGDKLILPCQKMTWPMSFTKEEYAGNPEFDPFMDDFYRSQNPIFTVVDMTTGKLSSRFGNLGKIHAKTKTGYYYTDPVITENEGIIAYSEGYSGRVLLADANTPDAVIGEYAAFDFDEESLPALPPEMYYNNDCTSQYDSHFYRKIRDMRLTNGKLHCILRYGSSLKFENNSYSYVSIDLQTGERQEAKLASSGRMMAVGLWDKQDGSVDPYVVSKIDGNYAVELFF